MLLINPGLFKPFAINSAPLMMIRTRSGDKRLAVLSQVHYDPRPGCLDRLMADLPEDQRETILANMEKIKR